MSIGRATILNCARIPAIGRGVAMAAGASSPWSHVWGGITYLYVELDSTMLRWGMRDGYDVEDITLTALGFDGVQNTDWEVVSAIPLFLIRDIDNNIYEYVQIGNRFWTTSNFQSTRYIDGTAIPNLPVTGDWAADITGAYCYYNNDIANKAIYGALYNWYAVNNAHVLAPAGWRVASDADWADLSTQLGGDSVAGGKLKKAGLAHWQTPNTGADNSSGFAALGAGARNHFTTFYILNQYGWFWASNSIDATNAKSAYVHYSDTIFTPSFSAIKKFGLSVRLVKDV